MFNKDRNTSSELLIEFEYLQIIYSYVLHINITYFMYIVSNIYSAIVALYCSHHIFKTIYFVISILYQKRLRGKITRNVTLFETYPIRK